jgi:hypothetical protein
MSESRHLGIGISRAASEVYDFVVDPTNLPLWAAGLSGSISFVDGEWVAESPMGTVTVRFAPRNEYGVLDHWVTIPGAEEPTYNALRVIRDGEASEVVFTLRRASGVGDEDFAADEAAIRADLTTLKGLLEG